MKLLKETNRVKLNSLMDGMIMSEAFYNPEGIEVGTITDLEVLERKSAEGQEYSQLQFYVTTVDGKKYTKRYNTDFARKFLNQFGAKAADTLDCVVFFKPTRKYKNIGWWAFVEEKNDGDIVTYELLTYDDTDREDLIERLKKLGL